MNDEIAGIERGCVFRTYDGMVSFKFRTGPVACWPRYRGNGTRGKTKAYGNYLHPKTRRSLALAEAHRLDGVKVRNKGNFYLPTAWDDRCGQAQRCWKAQRKNRWNR